MFSLLRSFRRPVPVRVGGRGIGEWGTVLGVQTLVSIPITAAFVVVSTGQAEFWLCSAAESAPRALDEIMGPNLGCLR
jgi:hypothetical protein